jgi:hypothetical protein
MQESNNTNITESIKKRKESVGVVEEKKKQKKSVTFSLFEYFKSK